MPPTTTTTTTTGTSTTATVTGDYAYVANSSAGNSSLSEYNVGAGSLASVGTLSLGYVPVALAVAPSNNFLYIASALGSPTPGLFLYTIGASGAVSAAGSGAALAADTVSAMAISPDGNWLFTINSSGATLNEYPVNTATGGLGLPSTVTLSGTGCVLGSVPTSQSCSVAVAPGGGYVVVSRGTSGDIVYAYSSANGIMGTGLGVIASGFSVSNQTGDFAVAIDNNNYAYIARTSSVGVYSLSPSPAAQQTLSYAVGTVPRGITLSKAGNSLYTANEGTGTISGLGIGTGGTLTPVAGSPFAGSAHVSALGVDNTGGYLVAVGYDATAGIQLFSIASTGVLSQKAVAGSGTSTSVPALVAMTH